jgi:hypothetical protein
VLNGTVVRVANVLRQPRQEFDDAESRQRIESVARTISPALTVLRGPFAGLKYPRPVAYGSALLPKLIGCYEMELHPIVEKICGTNYQAVHNIGCAEGYYAVGLARRMAGSVIHAYDIDPGARSACQELVDANDVKDRVQVRGEITRNDLLKIGGRSLILCDCEGYESRLIDAEVVRSHAKNDFLVEIHDNVDPAISGTLFELFRETHEVVTITSVDDLKKTRLYDFPELKGFSLRDRRWIVSEHRPTLMDWFWCTPRTVATG